MEVIDTLDKEGIISKKAFNEIQSSEGSLTDNPLRVLSDTVYEDPKQLRRFGDVLLQSEVTVHIGQDILKEYGKCLQLSFILMIIMFFV